MSTRGQKFTVAWRTPIYYADFVDDFSNNPTTGALATVINEASINQSIVNLVLTMPGERPGRASIGSKVLGSMFEPGTPASMDVLKTTVAGVIENFEPRAQRVRVDVDASGLADDTVVVTITYQPVNLAQDVTLSFPIRRVR